MRLRDLGIHAVLDKLDFPSPILTERSHAAQHAIMSASALVVVCTPKYAFHALNQTGEIGREYALIRCFLGRKNAGQKQVLFLLKAGNFADSVPEEQVPYVFDFSRPELEGIELSKLLSNLSPTDMPTKEKVQQLIASGRTDDALAVFSVSSNEGVLLQSRLSMAKKQYNMGIIDFGEMSRVQNQVNFALLDLVEKNENGSKAPASAPQSQPAASPAAAGSKQVFISYNHKDELQARAIKRHLEDNGIRVYIDLKMLPGKDIEQFIDEGLAQSNFLLPIISANSLSSGWVNREITAGFLAQRLASKKLLPIQIDNSLFDNKFYLDALSEVNKKIAEIKSILQETLNLDGDIRVYNDDLGRLRDLQSNLSSVIANLKKVKVIDLSDGRFDSGMAQIVEAIQH